MAIAIVPAQNEEAKIATVINNLEKAEVNKIIIVVNGSEDRTLQRVLSLKNPDIQVIYFIDKLGVDIPRAVGAKYAKDLHDDVFLFVDGDMDGKLETNFRQLIDAVREKSLDMALSNCYPEGWELKKRSSPLTKYRIKFIRELELLDTVGIALPSHGPHAVSRALLQEIPLQLLAIPPLSMVWAKQKEKNIGIGTSIPPMNLGSTPRGYTHSLMISETIIGDCLEAICYLRGLPPTRKDNGFEFLGYAPTRRFDILNEVLNS